MGEPVVSWLHITGSDYDGKYMAKKVRDPSNPSRQVNGITIFSSDLLPMQWLYFDGVLYKETLGYSVGPLAPGIRVRVGTVTYSFDTDKSAGSWNDARKMFNRILGI